jgi:hypothetical protein
MNTKSQTLSIEDLGTDWYNNRLIETNNCIVSQTYLDVALRQEFVPVCPPT